MQELSRYVSEAELPLENSACKFRLLRQQLAALLCALDDVLQKKAGARWRALQTQMWLESVVRFWRRASSLPAGPLFGNADESAGEDAEGD